MLTRWHAGKDFQQSALAQAGQVAREQRLRRRFRLSTLACAMQKLGHVTRQGPMRSPPTGVFFVGLLQRRNLVPRQKRKQLQVAHHVVVVGI